MKGRFPVELFLSHGFGGGNKKVLRIGFFQAQQFELFIHASRIACQASVFSDNPVAGNQDGDVVMSDCISDSLGRQAWQASFQGNLLCNLSIGYRFSVWNGTEILPYFMLEGGSCEMKRYGKIRFSA